MKKVEKEVKSGGKVIGKINIDEFANTAEAVKALGDEKVTSLINRQHASDMMNEFRAAKTRTTSPTAQLSKLAKTNPELNKQIEALIAKYVQ